MANFRALLNRLKEEYPTALYRGKEFEKICKWFLRNDPTYADNFKNIWLWYDWPDREQNGFGKNVGIDLVGETRTEKLWAIQAKCYIGTALETEHIAAFLSFSRRKPFANRLLICTGEISTNGKLHISNQDKPVQTLFYSDLNKSSVNWLDYFPSKRTTFTSDPEPIDYRYSDGELLDRGHTHDKVGEYEKAIESYSKSIQVNPYNARAYTSRGKIYLKLGKVEKAICDHTKAIESDPKFTEAYNERGFCYILLKEYEKAIENNRKAIVLDPKYTKAYIHRAVCYGRLGEIEKAIEENSKAIELDPDALYAYVLRGDSYRNLGEYEKAIKDYSKAIELDIKFIIYFNRALCYSDLEQYEKAIEDLTKLIGLDPKYTEAYYNRGNCYIRLGEYEKAIKDYSKVIDLNPKYAEAYRNKGYCYFTMYCEWYAGSDITEETKTLLIAVEDFSKAIELNPKYTLAYANRGDCYRALGEIAKRDKKPYRDFIEKAEADERKGNIVSEIFNAPLDGK